MAKNQLIDIYQKSHKEGYPDNYDPFGHSSFEGDAVVLRAFWNTLADYGNLDYTGRIASGPGFRKMVLSSKKEAIAYMASEMGQIGTKYNAQIMSLTDLALMDGCYAVDIWKPDASSGLVKTVESVVKDGSVSLLLPSFTDDLAVHIYKVASSSPTAHGSSLPQAEMEYPIR